MEKKRILFIEDRKSQFEILDRILDKEYFELINYNPIFDVGGNKYVDRDAQKNEIQELILQNDFDIILFDISLKNDEEYPGQSIDYNKYLCVEIFKEMYEELKNKIFVHVTSNPFWTEEKYNRTIGPLTKGAYFIRKVTDVKEQYITCPFIVDGDTKCGKEFMKCKKTDCFNKVLRRITDDRK